MEAHADSVLGGDSCHVNAPQPLPPRRTPAAPLPGPIWQTLTDEQRQKILWALTGILLKRLDAPPDRKEVRNERS